MNADELGLLGTVRLQPGQDDAPLHGRRVRIVRRQIDVVPGRAGIRCELADDGPDLPATSGYGARDLAVLVDEVQWDDAQADTAWLERTPASTRGGAR